MRSVNRQAGIAGGVAWLGLAIVLLVLTGFTIFATTSSSRAAKELTRSRLVSDAFVEARAAIDHERLLEHKNSVGHGGNYSSARKQLLHDQFDRAAHSAEEALERLTALGDAADRRLAEKLLTRQEAYHDAMDDLFTAANMGHSHMASELGVAAGRDFDKLEAELDATTRLKSAQTLRRLESLEHLAARTKLATIILIPFALSLFVLFAFVLRTYRRREEEATRAELVRLESEALVDNLTKLRNHRAWEEDLAHDLARASRSGEPLTLILVDLDSLKQVNDRLGHQIGDERLRALADAIRLASRDSDQAYRIGGDEFAVVVSDSRAWDALQLVERVQAELAGTTGGAQTLTAGLAETGPGIDRDELIRKADVALLTAKATRRSALVYSPELEGDRDEESGAGDRQQLEVLATVLARAVDARDAATRSHCETVAQLCSLIGVELGLEPERLAELRLAGLLHDVGKIGIPDSILKKPGPLDTSEYELMKTHSTIGYSIVEATNLDDEARFVLHHHERIDGGGYPGGLVGDEIPLESRIIFVADAFEAMTSNRPYRQAMSEADALVELEANAGTQFDPACIAALQRVLGSASDAPERIALEPR